MNLTDDRLRPRDIRKLVEPKLHAVDWDIGVKDSDGWIYASFKTCESTDIFRQWLADKKVDPAERVLVIHKTWNDYQIMDWKRVIDNITTILTEESNLIISGSFKWVLQYSDYEVARFGTTTA